MRSTLWALFCGINLYIHLVDTVVPGLIVVLRGNRLGLGEVVSIVVSALEIPAHGLDVTLFGSVNTLMIGLLRTVYVHH